MMSLAIATTHGQQRRQDGRLHRLRRCLRRGLVGEFTQDRRAEGLRSSPTGVMRAPTRRSPARMLKIVAASPTPSWSPAPARAAVLPQKTLKGAATPAVLPDPRRGERRLPARRRQGRGEHLPARRPRAGGRAACPPRIRCTKSAQAYVAPTGGARQGLVSTFGAHAWDAGPLMTAALPAALKKASPARRVPRRAARRHRAGEGSARRARHLQHVADRPPGPGPSIT